MKIKFYTTHCVQCSGVDRQLKAKNVEYEEVVGEEEIKKLGFNHAPILMVDDKPLIGAEIYNFLKTIN